MDPVSASGVSIAVVSLSFQLFAGCVQGFVLLSTAHNLGKDASTIRCMLNLEEYRLMEWARRVGLLNDPSKLDNRLNAQLAEQTLEELKNLLANSEKLKERYKMELVPQRSSAHPVVQISDSTSLGGILSRAVSDETRGEVLVRAKLIQSKNSFPQRMIWAAVDKTKFEALVRDIRIFVNGLWALLDPLQLDEATERIERTLAAIIKVSKKVEDLSALQTILGQSEDTTGRVLPLATSAGLKARRIEIRDDEQAQDTTSTALRTSQQTSPSASGPEQKPIPARRHFLLKPLSPLLLTDFVPKDNSAEMGIALYDGAPVFVEWKDIDPKLKRKIKPRAENLAVLLNMPKDPSFRSLHCRGFFEDNEKGKFAFVYNHPPGSEGQRPVSLLDLLRDANYTPSVTSRIKLALDLTKTLKHFHTAGWLHKNLRSENVLFFPPPDSPPSWKSIESPFLAGFGFARFDAPSEISEQLSTEPAWDIYRHPSALGEPSASFSKAMDVYSLGVILVELAEWRALKSMVTEVVDVTKDASLAQVSEVRPYILRKTGESGKLAFRMGEIYSRVAVDCLCGGPEDEGAANTAEDGFSSPSSAMERAVRDLERCVV
jgi:hypothetical protein